MHSMESAALEYHEAAKHHVHRFARSLRCLGLSSQPNPFRIYMGALIREGKVHGIMSVIHAGKQRGMKSMDESLLDLVRNRKVSAAEATSRAVNKALFEPFLVGAPDSQ